MASPFRCLIRRIGEATAIHEELACVWSYERFRPTPKNQQRFLGTVATLARNGWQKSIGTVATLRRIVHPVADRVCRVVLPLIFSSSGIVSTNSSVRRSTYPPKHHCQHGRGRDCLVRQQSVGCVNRLVEGEVGPDGYQIVQAASKRLSLLLHQCTLLLLPGRPQEAPAGAESPEPVPNHRPQRHHRARHIA